MNSLQLLRSLFDEQYTRRPTFTGFMVDFLYWVLIFIVAVSMARNLIGNTAIFYIVVWFGIVSAVFYLVHCVRVRVAEKKRPLKLNEWAQSIGAKFYVDSLFTNTVQESTLLSAAHLHKLRFRNVVEGNGWWLADVSFAIERSTKSGTYDAAIVYQQVLAFKLSRSVPNVFFDSKRYSARAFRWLIKSQQIDNLEGNFREYFRVFSPLGWQVDMRAIISPDVMLSIMDLKDYDVELSGDYVYIYGAMPYDLSNNNSLIALGQKLQAQLEDNLNTYRDNRLVGAEKTKRIHSSGAVLKVRNIRLIITVVSLALYLIIRLAFTFL